MSISFYYGINITSESICRLRKNVIQGGEIFYVNNEIDVLEFCVIGQIRLGDSAVIKRPQISVVSHITVYFLHLKNVLQVHQHSSQVPSKQRPKDPGCIRLVSMPFGTSCFQVTMTGKRKLEGHAELFTVQNRNRKSLPFTIPLLEVVKWHCLTTRGLEVNGSRQIYDEL